MMYQEFMELTGFEPTVGEYLEIEADYMNSKLDKQQFCKQWVKQGGPNRIAQERSKKIEQLQQELSNKVSWYKDQIDTITQNLGRTMNELSEEKSQHISLIELNHTLAEENRELKHRLNDIYTAVACLKSIATDNITGLITKEPYNECFSGSVKGELE